MNQRECDVFECIGTKCKHYAQCAQESLPDIPIEGRRRYAHVGRSSLSSLSEEVQDHIDSGEYYNQDHFYEWDRW